MAEAARAAAEAGRCVLVLGNDPLINGRENQDRVTLALPPAQDRLIRAVHAACPRLVLVVMSSYPYALGWAADHVPAIVWTSHGGQETGRALADVLLGTHEPAGRLAQTWYAADEDLAGLLDYDIIKTRRTYLYFDGCPLYPFGHGLSYTTFGYSGLRLDPPEVDPDAVLTVSVEVTNTGTRAGTEVVQCYTGPVAPRRPRPRGALAGFTRLCAGARRNRHGPAPGAGVRAGLLGCGGRPDDRGSRGLPGQGGLVQRGHPAVGLAAGARPGAAAAAGPRRLGPRPRTSMTTTASRWWTRPGNGVTR